MSILKKDNPMYRPTPAKINERADHVMLGTIMFTVVIGYSLLAFQWLTCTIVNTWSVIGLVVLSPAIGIAFGVAAGAAYVFFMNTRWNL